MNDKLIKHMVDRFLGWKLPEDFQPDAGISFKPDYNEQTEHPAKHQPVGTNLFTAAQAEEMIRYILQDAPNSPLADSEVDSTVTFTKVSYKINGTYFKALEEYYCLPWYKRIFKKCPKALEDKGEQK